jgi:hypothetical protein
MLSFDIHIGLPRVRLRWIASWEVVVATPPGTS